MRKFLGALIMLLGAFSSMFFFHAANGLEESGENLTQLRSRDGGTVAEAYYQEVGRYGIASADISIGLGVGILAISFSLGILVASTGDE